MENEFVQLVTQHQALIYKVCHLYADNASDVEDLFQEIVVNLWQAYPRFDGRAKVTTWMYRVALNTAITQLRRHKKRPPLQPFDDTLSAPVQLQDEQSRQLYIAIKQLDRIEKAIITLYLDGYNYGEIANTMGITENYVGVRLNRIKDKLRQLVAVS
jgi:RNA polymerase sigma-70 factor (ECF subfamily)